MKNDLFSIGPFTVHGYGLMIAIGVLAAYYTVEYRTKKREMEWEKVFPLAIWAVLGGFLGSKLLYMLTRLPDLIADPSLIAGSLKNCFVVYGGILGGIFSAWIFCRRSRMDFLKMFDLVMPSVALAQGFGRIGCFLAGCCYGMEVSGNNPIAVVFRGSAYA
ncbi:MAG: prolipoprotein diacylglyceryl transferase, partial [Eisenbergiella sp.]